MSSVLIQDTHPALNTRHKGIFKSVLLPSLQLEAQTMEDSSTFLKNNWRINQAELWNMRLSLLLLGSLGRLPQQPNKFDVVVSSSL